MNLIGRHPTRWWDWWMTEDGKKGKKTILLINLESSRS